MKNFFLAIFLFTIGVAFSQEICDNAIDDDADGLIDLNDDECECEGIFAYIEDIIPNPSFEEYSCCPVGPNEMACVDNWIQASDATSDYFNLCGFYDFIGEISGASLPLPCAGEGFVGFHSDGDLLYGELYLPYSEHVGTMLTAPMLAGVEYTLSLYTAWGDGVSTLELSIFGTPTGEDDLPWEGLACPVGTGNWELMASEVVTYTLDGEWQEVTLSFTPTVDMNAIAIGGPCEVGFAPLSYFYLDCLNLIENEVAISILESGSWCDNNLSLEVSIDAIDGDWQWYKDGIALVGETETSININTYGVGVYSAVYFLGDNCQRINYSVFLENEITTDFEFTAVCVGQPLDFTNTSVVGGGASPNWEWDFGDGSGSDEENPSHVYTTPGIFTVELIALNDVGCNDTIEFDIVVDPNPNADFEFLINGVSSEDGITAGCIEAEVQFNDLSTIGDPSTIVAWDWDFGDGGTSVLENPTHTYGMVGSYTITLTVTSDVGCTDSYTLDILMTNGLSIDLLVNEPTCYGFSDGSITIIVVEGGDDLTFIITDSDGNEVNVANSNTANTLNKGWYYFDVSDGSACDVIDSVFLDEPGQLAIDITVTDPPCFGDETGWARVDSVYNATGDYNAVSYIWNPNPAGIGGEDGDSTYNMGAGEYTLTINDENGCSSVFDFEVKQPDSLFFTEFGFEPAYCRLYEYQSGNGVVYGAAAGGVASYAYLWTNVETGETVMNSTWGGRNPGNYKLTITDANGCILERTVFLDSLNPIADFTVSSDQLNGDLIGTAPVEVRFTNLSQHFANPFNPTADTTFFWNLDRPIADWQVNHDYFEVLDTIYTAKGQSYTVDVCLVALNKNGCTDTACKIITIYEPIVFTPINIFTPNGDGKNDVFTFEFRAASISEFQCVIVNRWGVVMFEMDDITDAWDGIDKSGSPCNDGTYFYTYSARTDNGTLLKGQGSVQIATNN